MPNETSKLRDEIVELANDLQVVDILTTWQEAIHRLPTKNVAGAQAFILSFDPETKTSQAIGFKDLGLAEDAYVQFEKELRTTGRQTVLVSVDRVNKLRTAYPSFFLDTRYFVALLGHILNF
jgi:hypothetical protein